MGWTISDLDTEFDMYRHPHQLVEGEPFHQDFDIYSFGFLPVMIARSWKKIEDIPKIMSESDMHFVNPKLWLLPIISSILSNLFSN